MGKNLSPPPLQEVHNRVFSREGLLVQRDKSDALPDYLPECFRSEPVGKPQQRKSNRRGVVRWRLCRQGNRPPLHSIILSNVRLLHCKIDEPHVNRRGCHKYRESSVIVLMETFLHQDAPDSLVELEGFSCVHVDRDDSSGKSRGRGLIVYVSNSWSKQYPVRHSSCDPDLELLCISMRPLYHPRVW